jgi:hypothetical protein
MFCTAPSPARRNIPAFFVTKVLQLSSQRSFHADIYLFFGKIISPYRHYVFQHDYVRRDICCHFLLSQENNFAIVFFFTSLPSVPFRSVPFRSLPFPSLPLPSLPSPSRTDLCTGNFFAMEMHRRLLSSISARTTLPTPMPWTN